MSKEADLGKKKNDISLKNHNEYDARPTTILCPIRCEHLYLKTQISHDR
jgi:hypothetical protein